MTSFNYDQCYPYSINGNPAIQAVWCKSTEYFSNP